MKISSKYKRTWTRVRKKEKVTNKKFQDEVSCVSAVAGLKRQLEKEVEMHLLSWQ